MNGAACLKNMKRNMDDIKICKDAHIHNDGEYGGNNETVCSYGC